jgi:hypothetical protein
MPEDQSPPTLPPELEELMDGIRSLDKAAGLAAYRPLVEGAALAVGHAARRLQALERVQARAAAREGADSPAAQVMASRVERQRMFGGGILRAAARAAGAMPGQSLTVLEMAGFKKVDFDAVGMPWPGGDDGGDAGGSSP